MTNKKKDRDAVCNCKSRVYLILYEPIKLKHQKATFFLGKFVCLSDELK